MIFKPHITSGYISTISSIIGLISHILAHISSDIAADIAAVIVFSKAHTLAFLGFK